MDPTFMYEKPVPETPKGAKWRVWLKRGFRAFTRLLLAAPFGHRHFRNEDGSRFGRFVRAFTYRLAFAPLLLVMFVTAIVLAATHPERNAPPSDPLSFGVYYDPVNFLADDGTHLDGWIVPVIDAKRVLEEKESIVGKHYPAVVLVHDFTSSRQQLLPLVQPLHDAGIVVLAMNLRGGTSLAGEAQTFGIRESLDIKAGVDMLRRRTFVDAAHIALIGIGTGANACVITARNDPSIAAMVLAAPVANFDQAFADRVGQHRWVAPLHNLFRWTFEIMYGVDASDLDMTNFSQVIDQHHVLMTDQRQRLLDRTYIRGVQKFLEKYLRDQVASAK
jgi:hypothetical protein